MNVEYEFFEIFNINQEDAKKIKTILAEFKQISS